MMSALGCRDSRYYRAVELSIRLPWFIVNTLVTAQKERFLSSWCCASEHDLLSLCQTSPERSVLSIQQVVPTEEVMGGWTVRQITKLSNAQDARGYKHVVLEDDGGQEFSGLMGTAPQDDWGERELLFVVRPRQNPARLRRRHEREPLGHNVPLHPAALEILSCVSATEVAALLRVDTANVEEFEARGELFRGIDAHSSNADGFPLYQVWPTIPRQVFIDCLKILRKGDPATSPHLFFAYEEPDLAALWPLEVLLGALLYERGVGDGATEIMAASELERHAMVVEAAKNYAEA